MCAEWTSDTTGRTRRSRARVSFLDDRGHVAIPVLGVACVKRFNHVRDGRFSVFANRSPRKRVRANTRAPTTLARKCFRSPSRAVLPRSRGSPVAAWRRRRVRFRRVSGPPTLGAPKSLVSRVRTRLDLWSSERTIATKSQRHRGPCDPRQPNPALVRICMAFFQPQILKTTPRVRLTFMITRRWGNPLRSVHIILCLQRYGLQNIVSLLSWTEKKNKQTVWTQLWFAHCSRPTMSLLNFIQTVNNERIRQTKTARFVLATVIIYFFPIISCTVMCLLRN